MIDNRQDDRPQVAGHDVDRRADRPIDEELPARSGTQARRTQR
jgi:hypothetical protein